MANEDILSEDELEALAEGVNSGEVSVGTDQASALGQVAHYDFHQPAHLLKARLPALDVINERFCKLYQAAMFSLLHRIVEIEADEVQMVKYGDYVNSVPLTASISRVRVDELNGEMLVSIDAKLIFLVVDCFFGGPGEINENALGRDFTETEKRVIQRILGHAMSDLQNAWSPIAKLSFDYLHAESRAQMTNLVDVSDVVVLSKFTIRMNDVTTEMHIAMPFSILEPLRPILASGVRKEHTESDDNWRHDLKARVQDAGIEINAIFSEKTISLRELLMLKTGDFIPIMMKDLTIVYSEDVPLFEGKIGMSNQAAAIKLVNWHDKNQNLS